MRRSLSFIPIVFSVVSTPLAGQVEYRNLDGGRPVRVEDSAPTERNGLDVDLTTLRFDRLSNDRVRAQLEPRIAYGLFPNTEVSLRLPFFFRESTQRPRSGLAGVGIGAMRQLRIESLRLPAIAVSGDAFIPTGPLAARTAMSGKVLLTKTSHFGRLHLNGALGNFSIRIPPRAPRPPSCGNPGADPCPDPVPYLPPIDGPCTVSPVETPLRVAMSCRTSEAAVRESAARGTVFSRNHWLIGAAFDKAFPLRSVLLVTDIFAERFEGLNRPVDWTAELGIRRQVSPWLVMDAAVGRHYSGTALSSFLSFGTTISRSLFVQRH